MTRRPGVGSGAPELAVNAADAVALLTLSSSARLSDRDQAARILTELVSQQDCARQLIEGLVSVCEVLLALHEFETGTQPHTALKKAGAAIQYALTDR